MRRDRCCKQDNLDKQRPKTVQIWNIIHVVAKVMFQIYSVISIFNLHQMLDKSNFL